MATILFVRHADIIIPAASADPPLSAAGQTRAKALAHVAGAAGVTTIWTSPFKRTKQTVQPLATLLGLTPQPVPAVGTLSQVVASAAPGTVVLVRLKYGKPS